MSAATTPATHIRLDERGRAWVDGTSYKVIQVVMDYLSGLSPAEIRSEHYDALTLGQIHAALSYYYDHQAEIDAEIERSAREYEELRAAAGESPLVKRLRAEGKLP